MGLITVAYWKYHYWTQTEYFERELRHDLKIGVTLISKYHANKTEQKTIFPFSHFDFKTENHRLFGFHFYWIQVLVLMKRNKITTPFICFFSLALRWNNQRMNHTRTEHYNGLNCAIMWKHFRPPLQPSHKLVHLWRRLHLLEQQLVGPAGCSAQHSKILNCMC